MKVYVDQRGRTETKVFTHLGHLEMKQKDSGGSSRVLTEAPHHEGQTPTFCSMAFLSQSQTSGAPCVCLWPQLTLNFGVFSF